MNGADGGSNRSAQPGAAAAAASKSRGAPLPVPAKSNAPRPAQQAAPRPVAPVQQAAAPSAQPVRQVAPVKPVAANPAAVNPAAAAAPNRPVPAGAAGSRPIAVQRKKEEGAVTTAPTKDKEEEGELADVVKEAPAWMFSMIVHMMIFICLALIASAKLIPPKADVVAIVDDSDNALYAESIGEQLKDDTMANIKDLDATIGDVLSITPQNLPRVDNPLAAPPSLSLEPGATGGYLVSTSNVNAPSIGLALSGRQHGSKKNTLLGKYGGNKTTEESVINGLKWLARNQKPDGSWSLQGPYSDGGNDENAISATAMALLAFQGQGNTHKGGEFKNNVVKGWAWLLKHQGKDGDFYSTGPPHQRLYTQAQCSIAICELYGMTKDSVYRLPAELSVKYATRAQDPKGGGWRYEPGNDSDTSVTGWFVIALQSAKMAGLKVDDAVLSNISKYLDSAQENEGRRYAYTAGTFVTPAVTAEGLLCREYLGWKQDDPRLVEGIKALNNNKVNYRGVDPDVYYWYYATQATHHMEGDIWEDWNNVMKQEVPSHQTTKGAEAGSWDPKGDKWGSSGGRLYVTCLSIYMLEVYYRHLPIYSISAFK